ncbi:MAG: tetratricopeptide repeat protein [Bacteroidota bacterium]
MTFNCLTVFAWGQERVVDSLKFQLNNTGLETDRVGLLSDIGEYYFNRGIYMDSSFYYSEMAYELAATLDDQKQLARALVNLGLIESELNNFEAALERFQEAKDIVIKQKFKSSLSVIYSNMGGLYFKKEEYASAILNYKEAIAMSKEANDSIGMGIDYINLGDVEFEAGIYKDARNDLEYGMKLLESMGYDIGIAYANYAETLWVLNEKEPARAAALKALAIGSNEKDAQVISDASLTLSRIAKAEGNYKEALHHYREAMEQKYLVNTAKEENEIEKLKLNLALSGKTQELARANEQNKYRSIIYVLLALGVLLLILLISRQLKIKQMKAQIYKAQTSLYKKEARKVNKKNKFFAALYSSTDTFYSDPEE